MKSLLLLDTIFISDLDVELISCEAGPARAFFDRMRQADVFVSVVTLEEFYEKRGHGAVRELASRFSILCIHLSDAIHCGLLQTRFARRLGENDAWLAA